MSHSKALSRPTNYDEYDSSPPEIEGEIAAKKPFQLMPVFSGEEFKKLIAYPVIVEVAYGRGLDGSQKRKYKKTFSEAERKLIASYVSKFYRWHLVTGTPKRVYMKLSTLELLRRAVEFYASC